MGLCGPRRTMDKTNNSLTLYGLFQASREKIKDQTIETKLQRLPPSSEQWYLKFRMYVSLSVLNFVCNDPFRSPVALSNATFTYQIHALFLFLPKLHPIYQFRPTRLPHPLHPLPSPHPHPLCPTPF